MTTARQEQRSHILIVEDSPTQALKLKHLLEGRGYEVAVARDGEEAVAQVGQRPPALIISDVVMPGLDGLDLCERLKTDPRTRDTPVLLLTSMGREEDLEKGVAAGADEYVTKPYNSDALIELTEGLLRQRAGVPELSRGSRVLVVDDSPTQAKGVAYKLQARGLEVDVAHDGEEAIAAARRRRPDLILTDIVMPGMDGYELCGRLKSDPRLGDVPVVLLSSLAEPEDIIRGLNANADSYLTKPYDDESLFAAMDELTDGRAAERGREGPTSAGGEGLEVSFRGKTYRVTATHRQTLSLLLATYENTIRQNRELERLHESLHKLNRSLEERVRERTAAIEHNAMHDGLTSLPNRGLLLDRVGTALARCRRRPDCLFAVLVLGLGRFDSIKESLGPTAADRLLVEVSLRLRRTLPPQDTIARLEGDEFAVLQDSIGSVADVTRLADRFHQILERPFLVADQEVYLTARVGISLSDTDYQAPEELLRDANTAMHRVVLEGVTRHQVFDRKMHEIAVAKLRLENELRAAVERDELILHFQPILSLDSGRIVGFESLVRWLRPDGEMVPPGQFVPLAEETGIICLLGRPILEKACRQASRWQDQGGAGQPLHMAVNISARQFADPGLIDQVTSALEESGLDPSVLKLEITETAIMEDPEVATERLGQLKELGLQISLDDFGTGYSSLSYLHRFPSDVLKIDRSFVAPLGEDVTRTRIVRTIVALAHDLDIAVVAEGVETEGQLGLLREMGCDYAQGYFFSKPVPEGPASELLAKDPRW